MNADFEIFKSQHCLLHVYLTALPSTANFHILQKPLNWTQQVHLPKMFLKEPETKDSPIQAPDKSQSETMTSLLGPELRRL